jgi:hypothetical protein
MNIPAESNKSDLLNIPPLSSRWKALAIATALLTVFVHYSRISADRVPDWLANLPAIGATGYVALMAVLAFWMVRLIGRWVMRRVARGTNVEAFCRPVFMWAFLIAELISFSDGFAQIIVEGNTDQVGIFMWVCLIFFSTLPLLNVAGFFGWLRMKPILTADSWRRLAAIFVAMSVALLVSLPVASSSFHSWATDGSFLVGALLTSVAHILYANSAAFSQPSGSLRAAFSQPSGSLQPAFRQPSGSEVDRTLSNFNYAATDQDFRIGKYI